MNLIIACLIITPISKNIIVRRNNSSFPKRSGNIRFIEYCKGTNNFKIGCIWCSKVYWG